MSVLASVHQSLRGGSHSLKETWPWLIQPSEVPAPQYRKRTIIVWLKGTPPLLQKQKQNLKKITLCLQKKQRWGRGGELQGAWSQGLC